LGKRRTGFFGITTGLFPVDDKAIKDTRLYETLNKNEPIGKTFVKCNGEFHEIVITAGGAVSLVSHTKQDLEKERALKSLGGPAPGCMNFLRDWANHEVEYYSRGSHKFCGLGGLADRKQSIHSFRYNFRPYDESEDANLRTRMDMYFRGVVGEVGSKTVTTQHYVNFHPKLAEGCSAEGNRGTVNVRLRGRWLRLYRLCGGKVLTTRKAKHLFLLDLATEPIPKKGRMYGLVLHRKVLPRRRYSNLYAPKLANIDVTGDEYRIVSWSKERPQEEWKWIVGNWNFMKRRE
jgi:hypothetical protein